MTAKELEKRLEDMRIQYAKENFQCDNMDAISREDWINIYILLLIRENT